MDQFRERGDQGGVSPVSPSFGSEPFALSTKARAPNPRHGAAAGGFTQFGLQTNRSASFEADRLNSTVGTVPNFRCVSERARGVAGGFLRTLRAGCRSKRGGKNVHTHMAPAQSRESLIRGGPVQRTPVTPSASGSMFPRPPSMNKRVDRSRSTRFGNSRGNRVASGTEARVSRVEARCRKSRKSSQSRWCIGSSSVDATLVPCPCHPAPSGSCAASALSTAASCRRSRSHGRSSFAAHASLSDNLALLPKDSET